MANLKEQTISIPDGIEAKMDGKIFIVYGPKGTIEKIIGAGVYIELKEGKILLNAALKSRKGKRMLNTTKAHINNMISGVTSGYQYKLKICFGHFPMKVTVENNQVNIGNFLGEKIPRKAKILDKVKVEVQNDIITVEGADKESVGQTAANIERSTRITNRDRRVFQDGCFILK